MTARPMATSERFGAGVRHAGTIAIVTFEGEMGRAAVATAGAGVDLALHASPTWVVADLSRAELETDSVALLGLIRRRVARERVRFALAGLSPRGRRILDDARVTPLYRIYPSVPVALGVIGLGAAGSAAARRPELRSRDHLA